MNIRPMTDEMENRSFESYIFDEKPEGKVPKGLYTSDSLCFMCANLTNSVKKKCTAFPKGISDSFWTGEADHTTPYDGDGGITFEPRTS